MNLNLRHLLPESVSDQEASNLVAFVYRLAAAVEDIYLGQIMRLNKSKAEEAAEQMIWHNNGYIPHQHNRSVDDPEAPPF